MYKTKTPVAIIIFNRYDNAHAVLEQIRKAEPEEVFVIADGPRENREGEKEKCEKARSICDEIDWKCKVHKIFSDVNLGCAKRVSSGLTEVFNKVERALIFEDDCIPALSFFQFADEMLEMYSDDERIMLVSGNNKCFDPSKKNGGIETFETPDSVTPYSFREESSYFFSKQAQIWGWATWRRAWNKMDLSMSDWPELKKNKLVEGIYKKPSHCYYWNSAFDYVYNGHTNSWAFPWNLTVWRNGGYSIVPKVNLIRNAGFNADATHTSGKSIFENLDYGELEFPLIHPEYSPSKEIIRNEAMDLLEMKSRIEDAKQLPYPLNMCASKAKWGILKMLGKDK